MYLHCILIVYLYMNLSFFLELCFFFYYNKKKLVIYIVKSDDIISNHILCSILYILYVDYNIQLTINQFLYKNMESIP